MPPAAGRTMWRIESLSCNPLTWAIHLTHTIPERIIGSVFHVSCPSESGAAAVMRLGILGGTFDPIHHAHLFIAECARVRLDLDLVLFVPNGSPPHKTPSGLTSAKHRYRM